MKLHKKQLFVYRLDNYMSRKGVEMHFYDRPYQTRVLKRKTTFKTITIWYLYPQPTSSSRYLYYCIKLPAWNVQTLGSLICQAFHVITNHDPILNELIVRFEQIVNEQNPNLIVTLCELITWKKTQRIKQLIRVKWDN